MFQIELYMVSLNVQSFQITCDFSKIWKKIRGIIEPNRNNKFQWISPQNIALLSKYLLVSDHEYAPGVSGSTLSCLKIFMTRLVWTLVTIMKITLELIMNSQNIWWRVVRWISFSNIFWKLLLWKRYHQNSQVVLTAAGMNGLTLPLLWLLSFKAHGCKDFCKPSKPCHVGIHWIALTEYSQMSTHMSGFQWYFSIFVSFCIGKTRHQQHKS